MKSPVTGKEMILKNDRYKFEFRKEEFEIFYHFYECPDTGERFESEELMQLNLNQVYNQYRKKHNLPFPEDIKELREQYGLSASRMSTVLGFGINVYRNYEQGEIPSSSNARLIQLAGDPVEFRKLVELADSLPDKEKAKLHQKIDLLIQKKKILYSFDIENYLMGPSRPDETSGYRKPNLEKFTEMVVFFSEKNKPWKVKLNKLLFFADFYHFRKSGVSISGARYRAINMGPVVNNYQSIFEYISNNNNVDIESATFKDGVGEQFKPHPERKFKPALFDEEELNILNRVSKKFAGTTTQEMIDISHTEKAWKDNFSNGKQLINYLYAFDLEYDI